MTLKEYYETRNPLGYRINHHYLTDGTRNYFFKGINSEDEIIKIIMELLASEVLDLLNISHVKYRYFVWEGIRGTISDNFFDNGYEVMSGLDLITKYYKIESCDKSLNYNIDSIFEPVKYYFSSYPHFEGQMKLFTDSVMDMHLFDFLIANDERNISNFNIMFNDQEFKLGPLFDHGPACERSISYIEYYPGNNFNINALNELLNKNDERVFKRLVEFLSIINQKVISKLLNRIIEENNLPINSEVKKEIMRIFEKNYCIILRILINNNKYRNNEDKMYNDLLRRNKR